MASDHTRSYQALAAELARNPGIVVGVLHDPVYAGRECPAGLRLEDIQATWGRKPGVRIVPLDAHQIRSHALLFRSRLDILVYPYGNIYPMDAFPFFSGPTFVEFLRRGGAVLTTGGVPLPGQSLRRDGGPRK